MSLQFILGDAYVNHEAKIAQEIAVHLQNDDAKIYYIVPEHLKFDSELNMLNLLHSHPYFSEREAMGMIQLQVFSFNRLAWYLLQDHPVFNTATLSDTGFAMLIQSILLDKKEELTIYQGAAKQSGFIEQLVEFFKEARRGNIQAADLRLDAEITDPQQQTLALKLQDIFVIYNAFNEALEGHYVDQEDVLKVLSEEYSKEQKEKQYIYINHFQEFSALEQEVIVSMLNAQHDVSVALILDEAYSEEKPERNNLFTQVGTTYYRLYHAAIEQGIEIKEDQRNDLKIEASIGLQEIESYWRHSQSNLSNYKLEHLDEVQNVLSFWKTENKQAEVLHVLSEIKRLTEEEGYRYQDILLMSRNLSAYRDIATPFFKRAEVPLFLDENKTMADHPLVEFLDAIMDIYQYQWRNADIIRLLRTELFLPLKDQTIGRDVERRMSQLSALTEDFRADIDLTENVMLEYGFQGYQWTQEAEFEYVRYHFEDGEVMEQGLEDLAIQARVNDVRETLREALLPLFQAFDRAENQNEAMLAFYQFIERQKVPEILLYWRDQSIEVGELESGREHEQIWDQWVQILDEYVAILGDHPFNIDMFQTTLALGFEKATFSQVPPAIDQVIFTSLDKIQSNKAKAVFILGLTDDQLPLAFENKSVLTDEERVYIDASLEEGQYLQASAQERNASEPYIAYRAFTQAYERLYFTVPLLDSDHKKTKVSPYVERIVEAFQIETEVRYLQAMDAEIKEVEDYLKYIVSSEMTMGQIVGLMRKHQMTDKQPARFWLQMYRVLNKSDSKESKNRFISDSLNYSNLPKNLDGLVAEQLYGKDLYLSVSQLERYYLDPFSHFLNDGLRLKERALLEFTPLESGSFYHDVLDTLFKYFFDNQLKIQQMNHVERQEHVDRVLAKIFMKPQYRILSQSSRMTFTRFLLEEMMQSMSRNLQHQARNSPLRPLKTEVSFGPMGDTKDLLGLKYALTNGQTLTLRGKIDRIDQMEIDQQTYLSVVDYKSSDQGIDFEKILEGLSLQLLTYLRVALTYSKEKLALDAKPAGAFYNVIKNPYVDLSKAQTDEELAAQWLKKFQMDGFILDEDDVKFALTEGMEKSTTSDVFQLKLDKNGAVKESYHTKKDRLVTLEELSQLMAWTERKIIEAGKNILSGDIRLVPYDDPHLYRRTPSVSGAFQTISQFDALLPNNRYRQLNKMTKEQAFEIINKLEKGDDHA